MRHSIVLYTNKYQIKRYYATGLHYILVPVIKIKKYINYFV